MKNDLILVAGGGGFVGGHLVAELLRRGCTNTARCKVGANVVVGDAVGKHLLIDGVTEHALVIVPARCGDAELRPIARQRLRHILVGRTQCRALRIERGIVLISLDERPLERVR